MKEYKVGDKILMSPPGSFTDEEVTILHIPQHPVQLWIFQQANGKVFGTHTGSPIVKVNDGKRDTV